MKKLILLTIVFLVINQCLLGQTTESPIRIIPKTPEAATFEKFLNFPAVSSTGVPEINIPLHTLQYKGYTLPISISYHASGVKVNDIATPVGLNWVLNAGAFISRDIIGIADELSNFVIDSMMPVSCIQDYIKYCYEGMYDTAPDVFNYFLPGRCGKFIIKPGPAIRKSKPDRVRIDTYTSPLSFILYDEFGNKYTFQSTREHSAIDVSDTKGGVQSSLDHLNGSGFVVWKLDKITLPAGDEITFTYQPYNYSIDAYRTSYYRTHYGARLECSLPEEDDYGFSEVYISNQTHLVRSISTSSETISFKYGVDNLCSVMKTRLDSITVRSKIDGQVVKKILFNHGRYNGDPRLKLNSIDIVGSSTVNPDQMTYSFFYEAGYLPAMGSCAQDIFGYYNNNMQNHTIPVSSHNILYFGMTPADREVSPTKVQTGILTEIQYPTKGKIRYTYEPNSINSVFAPGVRIKTIEYLQSDGSVSAKKQYEYSNLAGYTHTSDEYYRNYELRETTSDIPGRFREERHWTSFPIHYLTSNYGHYSGFYYRTVNIISMGGTVAGNTIEEKYSGYIDFFSASSYLEQRDYKDINGYSVKRETYQYSNSTSDYHGWVPYKSYRWYGTYSCGGTNYVSGLCEGQMYYAPFQRINYTTNNLTLNKKIDTDYFESGTKSVSAEHDYLYNKYKLPVKITSSTSIENKKMIRYLHYADEYSISLPWLNQMKEGARHLVGIPIDERTYSLSGGQEYLLDCKINEYNLDGQIKKEYFRRSSVPQPGVAWNGNVVIPAGADILPENEYVYEDKDLVSAITPALTTTYIWGYNKTYPVAKIENATLAQVEAVFGETLPSLGNMGLNTSQNELLRNNLPNALVTTYSYKPSVGILQVMDPNRIETKFEYDALGRLSIIRNHDNYILKTIDYHFKP